MSFVEILGQFWSYFLLGALFYAEGGNPKGIEPPNFINGLSKIWSMVNLFAGLQTKIFLIKSIASEGASQNRGI